MYKVARYQNDLPPSWVLVRLCLSILCSLLLLVVWWRALLTAGLSAQHRGPTRLFMADVLKCFPFVHLLSSSRAKPAGNNNDTGGVEESDLEKMKQVKIFMPLLGVNGCKSASKCSKLEFFLWRWSSLWVFLLHLKLVSLENALESYRTVFLSGVKMVKSSYSKHLGLLRMR